MPGCLRCVFVAILCLGATPATAALDAAGNTDGILTWQIGTLRPGGSAREVVLFVFDKSHPDVTNRLDAARGRFATLPEPPAPSADSPPADVVWVSNEVTDFALAGPGHFFWEGLRQGLTCTKGGQLSRFGYYVHYNDGAARRAGTPITNRRAENLNVVEPIHPINQTQAVGVVETADKRLRLRVRAVMGTGPVAAVELVLTNIAKGPLRDVVSAAVCWSSIRRPGCAW